MGNLWGRRTSDGAYSKLKCFTAEGDQKEKANFSTKGDIRHVGPPKDQVSIAERMPLLEDQPPKTETRDRTALSESIILIGEV